MAGIAKPLLTTVESKLILLRAKDLLAVGYALSLCCDALRMSMMADLSNDRLWSCDLKPSNVANRPSESCRRFKALSCSCLISSLSYLLRILSLLEGDRLFPPSLVSSRSSFRETKSFVRSCEGMLANKDFTNSLVCSCCC